MDSPLDYTLDPAQPQVRQAEDLLEAAANCTFAPTRRRFEGVRLYGLSHSYGEVMELTGCDRGSLCTCCRKYRQQGIDGSKHKRRRSRVTALARPTGRARDCQPAGGASAVCAGRAVEAKRPYFLPTYTP